MKIFSIGFEKRTSSKLIEILAAHGIQKLLDVRCFPEAESAGYARGSILPTLLPASISYQHSPLLAPTPELLKAYFESGLPWNEYEIQYRGLLRDREVEFKLNPPDFFHGTCFMCLEHSPGQCHRKLALEYLSAHWPKLALEIVHL